MLDMRPQCKLITLALLFLLMIFDAAAQTTQTFIAGRLSDPDDAGVSNATVTLRSTTTDAVFDRRFGDNEHTFTVPGYARVDASLYYKFLRQENRQYRFTLNFKNLLDKEYYEGVRGRLGIVPGAGFNVLGSFQAQFQ